MSAVLSVVFFLALLGALILLSFIYDGVMLFGWSAVRITATACVFVLFGVLSWLAARGAFR